MRDEFLLQHTRSALCFIARPQVEKLAILACVAQ